jgi:hypothetical protein
LPTINDSIISNGRAIFSVRVHSSTAIEQ